jgi:AsmA protein
MSLTMAQGMKRLVMPIAALLGVAMIGLLGTSWFLNRDALREAVEAQIRAVTGLDLVISGSIDVSVFPGSYVSFHDVGLKGGGTTDPALRVDVLTANLRLLPLLLRRFEIADVMMLRPLIRVVRDGNGESNWTPFVETIARTMRPGAENQVSFSEIRIQDGVLNYEDATNHVSEVLGDIDLSLAWPSISRSFAATGQFDWRGERVDGSISAAETRLRRHRGQPHQHDDGRHRYHRQPYAAQCAALDGTVGARRRRLWPFCAEGPRQCRRSLGRIDECERRTRRQCR